MKWVTRDRPKTDRIACPWLIRKFIDPDAEFLYVPADQVLDGRRARRRALLRRARRDATPTATASARFEVLIDEYDLERPGRAAAGADRARRRHRRRPRRHPPVARACWPSPRASTARSRRPRQLDAEPARLRRPLRLVPPPGRRQLTSHHEPSPMRRGSSASRPCAPSPTGRQRPDRRQLADADSPASRSASSSPPARRQRLASLAPRPLRRPHRPAPLLPALLVVMALAGHGVRAHHWPPALILAALTGTVSTDVVESGPVHLARAGDAPAHDGGHDPTRLFGRYNTVATLAGSLGAALVASGARPTSAALAARSTRSLALPALPIAAGLSAGVERGHELDGRAAPPLHASRSIVQRLAALFALDSFGGGFVPQRLIAYLFARRYGAIAETLGARLLLDRHPPSGLVPGRRAARRPDRPAPHDGLHPPALEPPARRRRLRAEPGDRDRAAARPLRALADGRPDPPGLRRRRRRPRRAHRRSRLHQQRPLRRPPGQPAAHRPARPGQPDRRTVRDRRRVKSVYDLGFWTLFRRVPLSEQAADTP